MAAISALLDRLIRLVAALLLLALLASVVIGVGARQIGHPVSWSDELAQNLLVWTGFTGWMLAARRRNHIRIGVFIDKLPRRARILAEILIQLSVITFAVLLIRFGTPLIGRNWDIEWVSLPLPAGLLYLPIPFAAALLIGQALAEMVDAVKGRAFPPHQTGPQPL